MPLSLTTNWRPLDMQEELWGMQIIGALEAHLKLNLAGIKTAKNHNRIVPRIPECYSINMRDFSLERPSRKLKKF